MLDSLNIFPPRLANIDKSNLIPDSPKFSENGYSNLAFDGTGSDQFNIIEKKKTLNAKGPHNSHWQNIAMRYVHNGYRDEEGVLRSNWWKWVERTRQKKQEDLLKAQQDINVNIPAPIAKARVESLHLISKHLEHRHLPPHVKHQVMRQKERELARKGQEEEKALLMNQWRRLIMYWDLKQFRIYRVIGFMFGLISLAMSIAVPCLHDLVYGKIQGIDMVMSFWYRYYGPELKISRFNLYADRDNISLSQATVLVFFISYPLNLGALFVVILGFKNNFLHKKIMYYHSAGEMFFTAALFHLFAIILFCLSFEAQHKMTNVNLTTVPFILMCLSPCFAVLASLMLLLDDIIREFSRPYKSPRWLTSLRDLFKPDLEELERIEKRNQRLQQRGKK